MSPQDIATLSKLTMIAKKIIYDPKRMMTFLKMLGTVDGAITAVHTVTAAIQQHTQVPPNLLPQLGANVYLVMVDVAQEVTHHKADPTIVHNVVGKIMSQATQTPTPSQPAPAAAQSTPAPQGIIGQQMGAPA
jgi:hypothetical protein